MYLLLNKILRSVVWYKCIITVKDYKDRIIDNCDISISIERGELPLSIENIYKNDAVYTIYIFYNDERFVDGSDIEDFEFLIGEEYKYEIFYYNSIGRLLKKIRLSGFIIDRYFDNEKNCCVEWVKVVGDINAYQCPGPF